MSGKKEKDDDKTGDKTLFNRDLNSLNLTIKKQGKEVTGDGGSVEGTPG